MDNNPEPEEFYDWDENELAFTDFLADWRARLSGGVMVNGVPILPNNHQAYNDVSLITRQGRLLHLRFRIRDLYLIAFKRGDERWQQMKSSMSDPWSLGAEADKVYLMSSYSTLRFAAHVTDVSTFTTNLSALEESVKDLLNPRCSNKLMALAILRILLIFPESCRLSQLETFARDRMVRDSEGDDPRPRNDPFFCYDLRLDRLVDNWMNLCEIVANNANEDDRPHILAIYELENEGGESVLTVGAARGELRLLHGGSVTQQGRRR